MESAKNIVIAAITRYQSTDETRFKLALNMVRKATKARYTVVLIDESPLSIYGEFKEAGAHVYGCFEKGAGNARRESVKRSLYYTRKYAPGDSIIVMTEPEKDDLVQWIPTLAAPIIAGRADMVLPRRNEESWESYPAFQAQNEKLANAIYRRETGLDADPMFGPVIFRSNVANYVLNCQPFTHYGVPDDYIQHVAPMEALRDGCQIETVPIGFIYPPEQKAEEEGPKFVEMMKKRLWQQKELTETYLKVGKALFASVA